MDIPLATVYGEFWHNPNREGADGRCSGCRRSKFRYGYESFPHAHWVGGPTGHYMVCRGNNYGLLGGW